MNMMLSDFQEKQIDDLLEIKENNLETILKKNIDQVNFPFSYIREKADTFTNIERTIFVNSAIKMLKNIEEIDYIPAEQKTKFIQQLKDILIVLG